MPPAPKDATISYGPSFVPAARAIRAWNYTSDRSVEGPVLGRNFGTVSIRLAPETRYYQTDLIVGNFGRQGVFQRLQAFQFFETKARAGGLNHRQFVAIDPLRTKFRLAFLHQSGDRVHNC